MGLITSDQLAAIRAGAPIRQLWAINLPTSIAHSSYQTKTIDSGITPGAGQYFKGDDQRVLRAGSRKFTVFNPSPQVKAKPAGTNYSIVVDNHDGYFSFKDDVVWHATATAYEAAPQECRLTHYIYVLVDGAWSVLNNWIWTGRIYKVLYNEGARTDAAPLGLTATIICQSGTAWPALRRRWDRNDGNYSAVDDPGGLGSYTFTIETDEWD